MDYSKLIVGLTAEMKKGEQYKRMPAVFKWFIIVAMIPVIVSFVVAKFVYWVTLFFYKMISAPAEHLHRWLKSQKDEVHPATQAVMYFVCLPFIFSLQVLLSLNAFAFFILWFFIMVESYVLTLGGIKWQPIITEASFEDDGTEYDYKPANRVVTIVFACVLLGVFALYLLFPFIVRFVNPFKLPGLFKFLMKAGTVSSILYFVTAYIVNPILFKRVPKNKDNE